MIPSLVPDREIRFCFETLFCFRWWHCGYEMLAGATVQDVGRVIHGPKPVIKADRGAPLAVAPPEDYLDLRVRRA
jgi:hypothetical protein